MKTRIVQILPPQPLNWYRSGSVAARGGCSQHGTPPCHDEIVNTVIVSDAGSQEKKLAVCRRGLEALQNGQ
ncbi:hypothetical protein [Sphaerisporangium album]|uniref:hypothetical protein n=1 Tax=Sphaerisporangium album TaxID=509200 RepID=UPI0011C02132|nr:hypothetical protein [Sphaerisporangium album]